MDQIRRAKIVATLGPSTSSVEKIKELIQAGMNVARINMSHGTHEGHAQVISNIYQACDEVGHAVGILLDLQGPKIRVDKLPKPLSLKSGEEWVIGPTSCMDKYPEYKDKFIPTIYENLVKDARVGCRILFDDGLLEAKAIKKDRDVLKIKVIEGGDLKSNKGINLPDVSVSAPSFTDKDEKDLLFGLSQGIDFVAMSFVRTADDVLLVKTLLHKLKVNTPVVAKIEKPEAIENIEAIVQKADAIMIARGDMAVEIGSHLVPAVQKRIIELCNAEGKPVVTATQMLESMVTNVRPTRAEASDVANAIWDGTDAVMLSGETASGDHPIEAVRMMSKIILEAEKKPKERPFLRHMDLSSLSGAIQVAASLIAEKSHARWILSVTRSGRSCLKLSRFRPRTSVLGVSGSPEVVRRLCLYWGISPFYFETSQDDSMEALEYKMIDEIQRRGLVQNGDKIVITRGDGHSFERAISNSIRVEIIKNKGPHQQDSENLQEVEFDRGKILLDTQMCASCHNCISTCPHDIWAHTNDEQRDTYIVSQNASKCALDMECVEACPTGAIEIIPKV